MAQRMQYEDDMTRKGAWNVTTKTFKILLSEDSGQDLIEYSLLAGLISLAAVTMILNVGNGVNGVWTGVDGQMSNIPSP